MDEKEIHTIQCTPKTCVAVSYHSVFNGHFDMESVPYPFMPLLSFVLMKKKYQLPLFLYLMNVSMGTQNFVRRDIYRWVEVDFKWRCFQLGRDV